MCSGDNEDVVGAAPTGDATITSEWSTSLLPTKVRLILAVWRNHILVVAVTVVLVSAWWNWNVENKLSSHVLSFCRPGTIANDVLIRPGAALENQPEKLEEVINPRVMQIDIQRTRISNPVAQLVYTCYWSGLLLHLFLCIGNASKMCTCFALDNECVNPLRRVANENNNGRPVSCLCPC